MIEAFETPAHFKTYDCEMNESFSANCNVLVAILSCEDPSKYIPQILKAVTYLSESWFHGKWSDKWVRLLALPCCTRGPIMAGAR